MSEHRHQYSSSGILEAGNYSAYFFHFRIAIICALCSQMLTEFEYAVPAVVAVVAGPVVVAAQLDRCSRSPARTLA